MTSYVTEAVWSGASGSVSGGQNTPTFTLPASQAGDILIAVFKTTAGGSYHSLSTPSGWTKLNVSNWVWYSSNADNWNVCWRRMVGGETTMAYSFSDGSSGSNYWMSHMCRVYRHPTGLLDPVYAENCSANGQVHQSTWTTPDVTMTRRDRLVSLFVGSFGAAVTTGDITAPSGYANVTLTQDGTTYVGVTMADRAATALTDGAGTWSFSVSPIYQAAGTIALVGRGGGQQQIL